MHSVAYPYSIACCLVLSFVFAGAGQVVADTSASQLSGNSDQDFDLASLNPYRFNDFFDSRDAELSGTLELDGSNANGLYGDENEQSLRRARLGAGIDLTGIIAIDLTLDFDAEESDLGVQEARLKIELSKEADVHIGLMKQPFGMENNSSSKNLQLLERSLATDAFTPGRAVGLLYRRESDRSFFSFGVFADQEESDNTSVAGRFVWTPVNEKRSVRHLGFGLHYQNNETGEYRIRSDGSIQTAENFIRSERFNADAFGTAALEAGWMEDSISLQGEWFVQSVQLTDEGDAPLLSGGYLQLGWVLGNGRRKYSRGRFGRAVSGGNDRSTELILGYSLLRTRDNDEGDDAEEFSIGLHQHINQYLKISGQLFSVRLDDGSESVQDGRGALVRLQALF